MAEDADCWQESVTNITLESVDSALDWVLEQPMKTNYSPSSTTEALLKAMSDDDVRSKAVSRMNRFFSFALEFELEFIFEFRLQILLYMDLY